MTLEELRDRMKAARVEIVPELLEHPLRVDGEHVRNDADLGVVVEREVDVLVRDEVDRDAAACRATHGQAEGAVARSQQEERGREDGPRPILRVAEEAPGPVAGLDATDGEVGQLGGGLLEAGGHQVEEPLLAQAEGSPVQLCIRDEPRVLVTARAVEEHVEDRWVLGARQPIEVPERRQADTRLPLARAGEGVARGERVVHASSKTL